MNTVPKSTELEDVFLFINTDAKKMKSKTKDPQLGHQIQSHVQRGLRKKMIQKFDDTKELNASSLYEPDIKQTQIMPDIDIFSEDLMYGVPTTSHQTLWDIPSLQGSPVSQHSLGLDSGSDFDSDSAFWDLPVADTTIQTASPQELSVPSGQVIAASFDFTNVLETYVPALLRYWTDRLLPERFYFDARWAAQGAARHAQVIEDEIKQAKSSSTNFYSFLASIAVQMITIGEVIPSVDQVDLALWLRAKALEGVQSNIASGYVDKELVRSIQRLTMIANLTEMTQDAENHFEAMLTLTSKLGGLPAFDSYFFETEIIIHWFGAIRTLSAPRIKVSNTAAEPEEVSISAPLLPPNAPVTHADLAQWFQDLAKVMRFIPFLQTAHCKWASSQCLSVGYRLLSVRTDNPRDEAFRIASIFFIALIRSPEFDRRCASCSAHHLRRAVELMQHEDQVKRKSNQFKKKQSNSEDLTLWMSVIGALVAVGTPHEEWFITSAANAARAMKIGSFEALERCMSKVLYEPTLLGGDVRGVWARLSGGV